jgi:primosomal protein N' (replication factor Y) (superfamily II helicase)
VKNKVQNRYADIVFPVPVNQAYTYIIPTELIEEALLGVRVLAPFGTRKMTGFVVDLKQESDYPDLKKIEQILDPTPLFTPAVLAMSKWVAEYYLCGWGEVLKAALPSGIHLFSEKIIRLLHPDPRTLYAELSKKAPVQAEIVRLLIEPQVLPMKKIFDQVMSKNPYSSIKALRQQRAIRIELNLPKPKVSTKYIDWVMLDESIDLKNVQDIIEELRESAPAQAACMEAIREYEPEGISRRDLMRMVKTHYSVVKALQEKSLVQIKQREIIRDYYSPEPLAPPQDIQLNKDQQKALSSIIHQLDRDSYGSFLLYGVTGSGKTQVYIEAIHHALKKGKSAIVMVPEISLTPQIVHRFRSHFGEQVAVFHSRMSPGERYDSWRQTWEGKHKIVIGPRSAIFAPLQNLGLIVVDEEHEHSYKQYDMTPRYNARDLAIVRANLSKAAIVLGSATPSVESYFNAMTQKYALLQMPRRIDDIPMPTIELVDMKREPKIIGRKEPIMLSRRLREKIDEKLAFGEQIILLQNRRGFAPILKCQDCDYKAECLYCKIMLTFHRTGHYLKCHYCGYTRKAPLNCPQCHGNQIYLQGVGTQRVEEELHHLFPGVKVIRMDQDTTRGRMAHDKLLNQFGRGEHQILLGTQMVAKGLDFPNVTLVGVISADTGLFFPDFRAGERTFQLLTQVAGRAGRKTKQGHVIIQSYSTDHYSLQFAKNHDYERFFNTEIHDRKQLSYPPFSRIINVLFKGPDEIKIEYAATKFRQYFPEIKGCKILGPAPAHLEKIQGNYRWQILFMTLKQRECGGEQIKESIRQALSAFRKKHRSKNIQIIIDVDPISIL